MKTSLFPNKAQFFLTLILILGLAGCAIGPTDRKTKPTEAALLQKAHKAEKKGELDVAAREYTKLAAISSSLKQAEYLLLAADVLIRGNFIPEAERTLESIQTDKLHANQRIRKQLLSAKIALTNNQTKLALRLLKLNISADVPTDLQADMHELKAMAFRRTGNLIEAIREYIFREPFIQDLENVRDNQLTVWQLLMLLPDNIIQQMRIDPPPDDFSGWLELAELAKSLQLQTLNLDAKILEWRARYPQHPAAEEIIAALQDRQLQGILQPNTIALLLPLTGKYAKPAAALRNGFIAAHYNRVNKKYQPTIRVYDVGSDETDIKDIYNQAISDGAELVVGPLNKETVNKLMRSTRISVPTLTLNYGVNNRFIIKNLFQFGLAPEDEARQVAERAWLDGHNQALAIIPEGEWGTRVYKAFLENWESLGGTVMEYQFYPSENNDFSEQIRRLLNLDDSEQRRKSLMKLFAKEIKFEPRRRQDIDFIFMAAFPRQARLIRPQLKFHYASSVPIYATSHIYTGNRNKRADRDMDDIIFNDIPWNISTKKPSIKRKIAKLWPQESGQYTRIYALGVDAYNIFPQLNLLRSYPYERFNGNSGLLNLDESNHIFRQLPWARFRGGIPRPL